MTPCFTNTSGILMGMAGRLDSAGAPSLSKYSKGRFTGFFSFLHEFRNDEWTLMACVQEEGTGDGYFRVQLPQ